MKHYFLWGVTLLVTAFLAATIIPWRLVTWGKIETTQAQTITVRADATKEQKNDVARFNVGVSVIHENKEVAVNDVNTKMGAIIEQLKAFPISDEYLQTQSISVYEYQEPMLYDLPLRGEPESKKMQWNASNSIDIELHDVTRVSELADLLQSSAATSVNGPMLGIDDTSAFESELLKEAIEKAREKAMNAAEASGGKLGRALTIIEDQAVYPAPMMLRAEADMSKSGTPVELGATMVTKGVTVTFEIR